MLGIDNFLKHFILFSLTLILMVNIVYAFNLVGALGLPSSVSGMTGDFSNKYFGVSTLIDSFKIYFNEESNIPKFH